MLVGAAMLTTPVLLLAAMTWSLGGCSACGGSACPNQTFWLHSSGQCITKVQTACSSWKECNNVEILPPGDAGSCDVVATLEDGTTLTFSVAFTVKGRSECCGAQYEISPPSLAVGGAGLDAGMDAGG
jgi:hypothetical protein